LPARLPLAFVARGTLAPARAAGCAPAPAGPSAG
jgi:hypothetical protein